MLNKKLRLTMAIVLLLSILVTTYATTIEALAKSFAEYEQEQYLKNGPSPMDATPNNISLGGDQTALPDMSYNGYELLLDGTWDMVSDKNISQLLSGSGWNDAINAEVPGSIYTALMEAGVIEDPYYEDNMDSANAYAQKNWYFKRTFNYAGSGKNVELGFEGICNIADIYLNGTKIASHEGMFGGPYVDISDVINKGENTLIVHLYPAVAYTKTVIFNCSDGWHYANLDPLGIWQSVTIKDKATVNLDSPFVTTVDHEKGTLDLSIELDKIGSAGIKGELSFAISPKNFEGKTYYYKTNVNLSDVTTTALRYRCDLPEFKLWWPNGYGEQNLYKLDVKFVSEDGSVSFDSSQFGIRTVEYGPFAGGENQSNYNRRIIINGIEIFMKGAGWCTIDAMMRFSRDDYDKMLSRTRDAGINYMRAWGGGLVETDEFYDLCDEYGICIYQEWPCCWDSQKTQPREALYETVELNTKRLRNRASLILWGGGNEGTAAVTDTVLNNMCKMTYELDGTREVWRQDGWTGSTHGQHIHWSGASPEYYLEKFWNSKNINVGEYGLDGMMNLESMLKFATEEEIMKWPVSQSGSVAYHTSTFNGKYGWQQTPYGWDIDTFKHYASMFIELDSIEDLIIGSQLAQAQADYLPAINARINFPNNTMNTVYKLNDVYPGASWALVDWYGSPKMAYYLMQDAYRPLMAAGQFSRYNTIENGVAEAFTMPVYILDDLDSLASGKSWEVKVKAYNEDLNVIKEQTYTGKGSVSRIGKVGNFELTAKQTDSTPLIITVDLIVDGAFYNRNFAYMNFEQEVGSLFYLPRTTLEYSISGNVLTITNTGNKPAVSVNIDCSAKSDTMVLSDNWFWLEAGESIDVTVSDSSGIEGVSCFNFGDSNDNIAPTAPSNLNIKEVLSGEATVEWTASTDNKSLFGYNIYLNGNKIAYVRDNKTQYTLKGLEELREYTIELEAIDNNGNFSQKASVKFKTEMITEAPKITGYYVSESGVITLKFSTRMNKYVAEQIGYYLLNDGAKVVSATLGADGRSVRLVTNGVNSGNVYTLGVVGLIDNNYNKNPLEYTECEIDVALCTKLDFESDENGQYFTSGNVHDLYGFDGNSSVIDDGVIGDALALGTSGGANVKNMDYTFNSGHSISMWVNGSVSNSYNVFIAKGEKTTGHFEIYTNNGKFILYSPEFSTVDLGVSWSSVGSGWHHLAFVWEGNVISTYVDGVKKASVTVSSNTKVVKTSADITIGALNDGTLPFIGMIDEVELYTRVLLATEIEEKANGIPQPELVVSGTNETGSTFNTDFIFDNGTTIQFWFNATSFGTATNQFHCFFAKDVKTKAGHVELYTRSGILEIYAIGDNGSSLKVSFGVNMNAYAGEWHLLTLVAEDSQMKLYIDKEIVKTSSMGAYTPYSSNATMYVGKLSDGSFTFNGKIVDFELLNKALSEEEIADEYNEKLVYPKPDVKLGFAKDNYTVSVGESVALDIIAEEGCEYTLSVVGDSVTLDGNTVKHSNHFLNKYWSL
jgi:beta-mannosidase